VKQIESDMNKAADYELDDILTKKWMAESWRD
jgi:hypothetical protein